MSGVITRGSIPKALWPGLNAIWGMSYKEYNPEWKEAFETATSDKAYEEDLGLTAFGLAPEKPEGDALSYDTMKQSYVSRYTNISYALGFIITREEIEDCQYAQVGADRTRGLAFSMTQTKENVAANIFNRAFNSSYPGGDTVELLSTAHPIEGGTFSNTLSTPADLSEASLEQSCIDIANFVDQRNKRIAIQPKKLIVPVQEMFNAERILANPYQPNTTDRNINAMYQMGMIPGGFSVNHYLTDNDAWFITTNCPKGLRYFEREAARFEDDNDFDTKNGKYSAYERYVFGWTDPRGLYGSPGA